MGNRLAPLLAIAYMDRIERNSIDRDVILYKRYIDDILIIARSQESLTKVFECLHRDAIRLTRESPNSDGWLAFLNLAIRIREGSIETKWYRKLSRKNIIINCKSAHPYRVKVQTIRNMIYTAKDVSSSQFKEESRNRALELAYSNGYTEKSLEARVRSPRYVKGAPCLRIPFISDSFSFELQRIFKKYGIAVNVLPKPSRTLKEILVRSRLYDKDCDGTTCFDCTHTKRICKIKGAIYEIECAGCREKYIGETGRCLVDRIKEHLADLRYYENRSGPWAVHRRENHAGNDITVTVKVRAVERNLQERKVKEALLIKLEKPSVNARVEMAEALKFLSMM